MFLRRNVAGQVFVVPGSLRAVADGAAVTSGTITIVEDGTATAGAGTLTHISGGAFKYAPTQGETDCAIMGFVLEGTGAVTVCGSVRTTNADPDDGADLGLTNLDAAVSSRSAHAAADVWAVATRLLTAGTNIVLAKGTGVTGFNDIAAADVWAATTRTITGTVTLANGAHGGIAATMTLRSLALGGGSATPLTITAGAAGPAVSVLSSVNFPAVTVTGSGASNSPGVRIASTNDVAVELTGVSDPYNAAVADQFRDAILSDSTPFDGADVTAIAAVANKLDTALELDGSVYRYTTNALEQGPSGGGGGTTDWTADERTAIRSILGVPAAGTTPEVPAAGALATLKADTAAILADTGTDGVVVAAGSKAGYSLAAAGLDAIAVESGVNARQALSPILAAAAGVLSGAATSTVLVKAGNAPATTRITATCDGDGNRTAVTLSLPV